jgi:hypothetical protein
MIDAIQGTLRRRSTPSYLRDDGDAEVQHTNIIMRERAGSSAETDCAMIYLRTN